MRHLFAILLLLGSSALSFGQIYPDTVATPEERWSHYYPGTDLKYEYMPGDSSQFSVEIVKGKYTVLEYFYKAPDQPMMADDEYSERILVRLPKLKRRFTYNLTRNEGMFTRNCFCMDGGNHRMAKAVVKGKKVGRREWAITIEMQTLPQSSRGGIALFKAVTANFLRVDLFHDKTPAPKR